MAEKLMIYFHIGQPKTGTSAIQAFFNYNREILLKEHNILYPNFKDNNIAKGFYHNHGELFTQAISNSDFDLAMNKFASCQVYCAENDISEVVISWEGFQIPQWIGLIDQIQKKLNCEVKIILYLRRQDLLYESSWKQWGHKNINIKTIQEYIASRDKDHLKDIRKWLEYFTPEQFIVRTYEKSCIGDDVVTDFLKIVGINSKTGFIEPPDNNLNVNAGLKPEVVEMLRLCNYLVNNRNDHKLLNMMYSSLSERYKKRNPFENYGFLTLDERKAIIARFDQSNREIAKIFFGESRENLFLDPLEISGDEPEYFTGLTLENTIPVFMELMLHQADQIQSLIEKNNALSNEMSKNITPKFFDLTFVSVDLKEFMNNISDESQITGKRVKREGFEFTSTGKDPAFIFADYPTFKNTRAIRIEITTPAATNFQFFFTSRAATQFVEKNSIVKLFPEGRSKSILYFSEANISGRLRIDPGDLPGKYIIHQFEIGK
jgi:hypothetical protein